MVELERILANSLSGPEPAKAVNALPHLADPWKRAREAPWKGPRAPLLDLDSGTEGS